jgi:uncharacterized protein YecA (UPF0149 family)
MKQLDPFQRAGRRIARWLAGLFGKEALAEEDESGRWASTNRNDPCPCGSGKKYKKCCWTKRHH